METDMEIMFNEYALFNGQPVDNVRLTDTMQQGVAVV